MFYYTTSVRNGIDRLLFIYRLSGLEILLIQSVQIFFCRQTYNLWFHYYCRILNLTRVKTKNLLINSLSFDCLLPTSFRPNAPPKLVNGFELKWLNLSYEKERVPFKLYLLFSEVFRHSKTSISL